MVRTMHWTRIGVIASAGIAFIGVCLPWLTDVPPGVLKAGDGTILGITTIQGIIAAGCAASAIAAAILVGNRKFRVHRGVSAGFIGAAIIAIGIGSLVLGTSQHSLLEDAEAQVLEAGGSKHLANLAVIALAKKFDKHDMDSGIGQVPFALGCALLALFGIISMFIKGEPKQVPSRGQPGGFPQAGAGPPPGMG